MRYALYFTPPADDPLTKAAAAWLGRDPFSGKTGPQAEVSEFSPDALTALTADPRRYGFHATLKAPFRLAPGTDEAALEAVFSAFCAETPALEIPNVVIEQIGPFFALVPDRIYPALQDFAAAVVETFEPFRAELTEADIARRRPERMSDSQRANLSRWGYHHVMDDFRFHMTLTGPVEPESAPDMRTLLAARFADFVRRPLAVTGLALYVEATVGAPFTVHSWLPLTGAR